MRREFEGTIDKPYLHWQYIPQAGELKLSNHDPAAFKVSFFLSKFLKVKNSKQASNQKLHLR